MKPVTLPEKLKARVYTGLVAEALAPAVAGIFGQSDAPVTVAFTDRRSRMEALAEDLPFFLRLQKDQAKARVLTLPDLPEDQEQGQEDVRFFDLECDRATALTALNDIRNEPGKHERLILLTTPKGFFTPVPKSDAFSRQELRLAVGKVVPFNLLIKQLGEDLGYENAVVCETPGQFAVRGGLIDIYPVNASAPVRVDFFGDEIDGLREFDPTTQRTEGTLNELSIAVLPDGMEGGEKDRNILDYFGSKVDWIFVEPEALREEHPAHFNTFERMRGTRANVADLLSDREGAHDSFVGLAELDADLKLFPDQTERHELRSEPIERYRTPTIDSAFGADRVEAEEAARRQLFEEIVRFQEDGHRILFSSRNEAEEARLKETLRGIPEGARLQVSYHIGSIRRGFRMDAAPDLIQWEEVDGAPIALVTTTDIFGRYKLRPAGLRNRKMPHRAQVDQLLDFSDLVEGDYLVHLAHGVCIYRGLTQMEFRGRKEEMISLEFAEKLTLHLPLHESHLLSRYVGLSKVTPKLGKLGTNQWEKTRQAAEKATLDFAADLLSMQAKREESGGFSFSPDTQWQKVFEDSFIHEETPDQLTAIEQAKADMELENPMDRLVCGDVGFGKTEVALRAAFKAVMDGKQVALLVPTTVLAQQHLNTFRERMAEYPVSIEMVSRFRSRQEQTKIIEQTQQGRVDILIGTHRLLSKDVHFKDLGLLIIDEEHRFGVRHKERIKAMKADVDVITMSATPIPRTLYMALMGARQLSVIETPPVDRLPIQTIVKSYDPELVRKAIDFELERGGQVFYLHNRVQTIDAVAERLQELCPKANIAVGHGQMTEQTLEKIMTRFVAGQHDVLVCTTIIESGLDIPNCNTIIIEGADRFGLAQLYQLRGRVGRFNRQAYAYLLLHRHSHMLDQARKRLTAMRQYNQLGAGFKIAMRDLELRGAGNLLGAQQSGHIAGVGFDLYCQLLRQSIGRLKGEETYQQVRANVRLDFVSVGQGQQKDAGETAVGFGALKERELEEERVGRVEAYLPVDYIPETRLRVDFYRRLAMAATTREVKQIGEDLVDRFGRYEQPVEVLLLLTETRTTAEQAKVVSVETEGNRLKCRRATGKRDDYIKVGARFPRLTAKKPILRLREIIQFLNRHTSTR